MTYEYKVSGNYIGYLFDKYMWNFGYDKANLIAIIFYIILFFTLINGIFYKLLQQEIHHIPFLNVSSGSELIEKNFLFRYLFYLPLALIYTVLIMFKGLFVDEGISLKSKNFYISLYFVLLSLCGIFSTFLILQYIVKN